MTTVAVKSSHKPRSRETSTSHGNTSGKPLPVVVTARTERKYELVRNDAEPSDFSGEITGSEHCGASVDETELYVSGNLQLTSMIEGHSQAMCVRFSIDGNSIASGFADGTVRIHDFKTGKCLSNMIATIRTDTAPEPVTCIRFLKSTQLLIVTYATGQVRYWDSKSFKCLATLIEERSTMAAAFNPTRTRLVTVGSTPEIYLYDVRTGQRIATLEAREHRAIMDGHRARVYAAQYHAKHPNVFLTGGWDDTVQYWDDRVAHAVRKFYGPHICGDALDIDVERGQVLTGSWRTENALQIWDFDTGNKIHDVPGDKLLGTSSLYCAQWLGKEHIIAGGSDRNLVRTISRSALNTTGQLSNLASGVYSIDSYYRANRDNPAASLAHLAVASSNNVYLMKWTL